MPSRLAPFLLPLAATFLGAQGEPPVAPGGPVLELTLEDAMRLALQRNLDLDLESVNTEIARFDSLGSFGVFDPVVTLTGALSDSESQGSSGLSGGEVLETDTQSLSGGLLVPFTSGGNLDLTYDRENTRTNNNFALFDTSTTDVLTAALTQPLLRNGWRRYATAAQREAELDLERQVAHEAEVRQRVLRDVAHAYWDLVGAREELGVRDIALETARAQLEQSQRRLELEVGTEVDVLQAETNVALVEEERLLAESNLRAAEDLLRRLLFQRSEGAILEHAASWDQPVRAVTPLPEPTPFEGDWLASLERALRLRPELRQQQLEIAAAGVRLERAESLRLPALDLVLRASSSGFDEDPSEALSTSASFDFPTYTGSLTFSMPVRNRTARYAEHSARAAVRASRIVYEQIELDVLAEVRTAVRDLAYAAEQVRAAEKSSEFADRQLAAEQARFREGLSTTFQVLEFQRDRAEALSALTRARAQYAKAEVTLLHAQGALLGPGEDG
jgi:outer membrane protein TolC